MQYIINNYRSNVLHLRILNLKISNHVYFNLAGHGSGWEGLGQHKLQVFDNADDAK